MHHIAVGLPILSGDEAVFTPSDFVRYLAENRGVGVEEISVPEQVLVTYQGGTYQTAKKMVDGKSVDWWMYGDVPSFCSGTFDGVEIGVARFMVGAPAAAMTSEELIACGAKVIFEVGYSGGLQDFLNPGSILVVTEAIRDEGTSHHYLSPTARVESSMSLRNKLIHNLEEDKISHFVGRVWSTDGVYRETRGKFRKFRSEGVLGVNMETSAIFAVAKYRQMKAASAQIVSDILTETGWLQAFDHQSVKQNTQKLLRAVLETLSKN